MEIQKNGYFRSFNINHFTFHAIASAVFMLNAEIANAASCPLLIDTSIAGVCDFDTNSSVTVASGGSVGGIHMASRTASFITITSGGRVSNSTGIGIEITNSSLSNGLSNSGTISNTTGSGIVISTSTINGGLSNNGLISTGNGGIAINRSNINNGILNSGTINSSGTGIKISTSSSVNGGISNSGTIAGGGLDDGLVITNQSIVNGGINNNGLIEASGGDGILIHGSSTLNGGISNNGTINSIMQVGIDISDLSQILDNVSNSGIISGGAAGLSIRSGSAISGSIFNNGMISGENGISITSSTINGNISNSGTIRGANVGIAASSATINGGISNSGIIQGNIFAINLGNSTVDHIDIIGQSARVIGAVQAVNTDFNITSGAIFTSEGTFDINHFNIAANALFNMVNTITAANGVNNSGTLAVGDATQTITGNYTQNTGGIFQTYISSLTNFGRLSVSDAIDLSQSGKISVLLTQNATIHSGDVFNIMEANTLVGPTNGFQVTDNSFFWEFIANDSANTSVNLTAIINPEAFRICQGDYCQGTANTIIRQIAAGNSAFSPFATLETATAFKTAASQATPELINENIQVMQWITKSAMDIVPMWSTLHGQSAGDAMIYHPGKIWIKPYGGSLTQNESHTVQGFDATAYGIVIGKDIPLNEDWLFGGAFAVGKDNMHGKSVLDGQSIHSDEYQGMVYAAKTFPHHLYFAGQALVGYGDNDTERNIPLYASTAEGSYNSWFTNIRAQFGWSTYAFQDLVLTPEIDASYLFINQGSYRESGSMMDLRVDDNNNSSLVLGAYGHAAYRLKQNLTLTGYVGVARDVLNDEPETKATFVAGGAGFSTFGVQLDEFVFRGGVGLTYANPAKPLYVNVNYDLQSGNNAYSGVGTVTVAYKI